MVKSILYANSGGVILTPFERELQEITKEPQLEDLSENNKPKKKRESVPAYWKDKILRKQNNKCAGKDCVKNHGKKISVNSLSHFDHIKPLALKGKHDISNLQALCPNCHSFKTKEDRYNISQARKKEAQKRQSSSWF